MNTASIVLNILIFIITLACIIRLFCNEGKWAFANIRAAFRFFTVQSNAFCAAAALLLVLSGGADWAWILKYVGTAAVTVTMITVFVFLAPSMEGGLWPLLKDFNFFMHFLTPVLAIVSFSVFENRSMDFGTALLGVLPVVFYGSWYLYKAIFAPEGKRWEDFYGFNKGGKWPVSFAAMLLGTFLISMSLMALQNL